MWKISDTVPHVTEITDCKAIYDETGEIVCLAVRSDRAPLIAAASDLMLALQRRIDIHDEVAVMHGDDFCPCRECCSDRKLIAKAKGES